MNIEPKCFTINVCHQPKTINIEIKRKKSIGFLCCAPKNIPPTLEQHDLAANISKISNGLCRLHLEMISVNKQIPVPSHYKTLSIPWPRLLCCSKDSQAYGMEKCMKFYLPTLCLIFSPLQIRAHIELCVSVCVCVRKYQP